MPPGEGRCGPRQVRDGARARVRHDKVDKTGAFTLRHGTRFHHVGIGRAPTRRHVSVLVADLDIRVLSEEAELFRHLTLDPERNYQPIAPKVEVT